MSPSDMSPSEVNPSDVRPSNPDPSDPFRAAAPLFSVVIPSHNRASLLPRSIGSVLTQTMPDFELLVVDDGSTDDTREVVRRINDPRLRYVWREQAGAAAARNFGAHLAAGRFLTFLDSDDEALPHWLQSFQQGFAESGAAVVCCGCEKVGNGPELRKKSGVLLPQDLGPMFGRTVGKFTNGGVFAMRREVFEAVGGYAENLRSGQHTELAMRLVPMARKRGWIIHNVMEPLVRVHVHPGPRIRGDPEALYEGTAYILDAHRALYRSAPREYAKTQAIAGVSALRIGRNGAARRHFLRAITADPTRAEHWARLMLSLLPPLAHRRWERARATAPEL